jgi:hypothetical protein
VNDHAVADFMSIFRGSDHNYGQHVYGKAEIGAKVEGRSKTVKDKLLTVEQYKAHLNGKVGLGIIPIDKDNKTQFCVIDVDLYADDLSQYITAIERGRFPLVPFRSKSGGLHLYMFLKQAAAARRAVELMRQLSSLLSIDALVKQKHNKMVEVFPKQYKLDSGNVGSWINLPYFNAEKTNQYAIREGKPLSLADALVYVKEQRRTVGEVQSFIDDQPFSDGPPCLQAISTLDPLDAESGGRNVYLFTMGVYLKKKDETYFEQKLYEINHQMSHPVDDDELEGTVLASLRKKDYSYKCYDHPCVTFCNRPLCKQREFGIGKEGGYFSELEYGQMYQFQALQPYYEWEVKQQNEEEFKRLRFHSEDEIIKQDAFLRLCFRELKVLPVRLKQSEWFKIVNQSLAEIKIEEIDAQDDTSPRALLRGYFLEFLVERRMAQSREQLMMGRVYREPETDLLLFRSAAFVDWLMSSKNFRYYQPGEIHGFLKDLGVEFKRVRTESGKQFRVNTLPYSVVEKLRPDDIEENTFEADLDTADTEQDF